MDDLASLVRLLPLFIPLFLVEMGLMVIAVIDIVKRERVRGGNKVIWLLVAIFVGVIGPIVYLLFGREEAPHDSD